MTVATCEGASGAMEVMTRRVDGTPPVGGTTEAEEGGKATNVATGSAAGPAGAASGDGGGGGWLTLRGRSTWEMSG